MFHPRKRPRFSSNGELTDITDEEDEGITHLTPPDKYLSEIPSFESLLAIPLHFAMNHVKNQNEAVLLFELGTLGAKLDTLIQYLVVQLQQEEVLERKWRSVCSSRDPFAAAFIPSLAQVNLAHFQHQSTLYMQFLECIESLKACKQSLTQYVEMNKSVAEELMAEGCVALAENKISVGRAEELLLSRIDGILNGSPFLHSSIMWESIIGPNANTNVKLNLLHDPKIDKGSQEREREKERDVQNVVSQEKEVRQSTPTEKQPNISEPNVSPIQPTTPTTPNQPAAKKQRKLNPTPKAPADGKAGNEDAEGSPVLFESDASRSAHSASSASSTSSSSGSKSSNHGSSKSSGRTSENGHENKTEQRSSGSGKEEKDNFMGDIDLLFANQDNEMNWQSSQQMLRKGGEGEGYHDEDEQLSQCNTPVNNDESFT